MGFFDTFFKEKLNKRDAFEIAARLSVRLRDGEFSLKEFINRVEFLLDKEYEKYPNHTVTPEQSRQIAGLSIYLSDHHDDFYKEIVKRRDEVKRTQRAHTERQERIKKKKMDERSKILSDRESEVKKYLYQGYNIDEAVKIIMIEDNKKSDPFFSDRYIPNYGPLVWMLPDNPMSVEEKDKYLSKFDE